MSDGICKCGCGGRTAITTSGNASRGLKKGRHVSYIQGHNSRGRLRGAVRWADVPDIAAFYRSVGDAIRQRRVGGRRRSEPLMTQRELGVAVGLSPCAITNIEAGRQRVSAHTLARIATALNVNVDGLYPAV